jgi:hypothetical protein
MSKSRILLAGASLFVTLVCWSLSSPINSHEDETYHLASIWCAQGYEKQCEPLGFDSNGAELVLIKVDVCRPQGLEGTNYKRLLIERGSVKCKQQTSENDSLVSFSSSPNNFYETKEQLGAYISRGHHSNIYYSILHNFITENTSKSIIAMRIFNSAIFTALFVLLLLVATSKIQISLLLGLLLTMIPQGVFLLAGINVSGWAYTGCSFSWAFLYVLIERKRKLSLISLFALFGWLIASALCISSRYDSIIFLIVTNALVFLTKAYLIYDKFGVAKYFLSMAILVAPFALWLSLPEFRELVPEFNQQSNSIESLILVFGNAVKLAFSLPLQVLGLGVPLWLDIQVPRLVFASGIIFLAFTMTELLRNQDRRSLKIISLCFTFYFVVCLSQTYTRREWFLPFYLIRTGWNYVTGGFSPRYILPVFPFLVGIVALLSTKTDGLFRNPEFKSALTVTLGFTHATSLYTVGSIFRNNPEWYWTNLQIGIDGIYFIGTSFFIIFLILCFSQIAIVEKP